MNLLTLTQQTLRIPISIARDAPLLRSLFAGILLPFGFAPFHFPGLAILGVALLFAQLNGRTSKDSFWIGFVFGLGFLGFGVSWVYVSIHEYGHLNALFSAVITSGFVSYLALFPAVLALIYSNLSLKHHQLYRCLLFCSLWCLAEYLRSFLFTGFPWMLLGITQMDTPLKPLLPILGIYGVGFLTCFSATCLVAAIDTLGPRRYVWLSSFIGILLAPSLLQDISWTKVQETPISVGIIQANMSMRDKWDESLFWDIVEKYQHATGLMLGHKKLIVMPESAFPLPASYVSDQLESLDILAKESGSAILFGIPKATDLDETDYFNTVGTLGMAEGQYIKQHLVPFGEYIPHPFQQLMKWLALPSSNLKPGKTNQPLILVDHHPIASLICYELAYPHLLRKQLPKAEWIVSISDDGWFGHSLAMYQQLQIAQGLSAQTGRYQVVSNNDGLSSIINHQGTLIASLPAFTGGILESEIYPATGVTPWFYLGDVPVLFISVLLLALAIRSRYLI
ncbi:MAG: apolipoprotein N-acyltransferase [Legionellales bacterium]|nr:apolipoprotein N-acyltransferase [Legionellales bacterium]